MAIIPIAGIVRETDIMIITGRNEITIGSDV